MNSGELRDEVPVIDEKWLHLLLTKETKRDVQDRDRVGSTFSTPAASASYLSRYEYQSTHI